MTKSELNRFEKLRIYLSEFDGRILSARELSDSLGLSHSVWSLIENGKIAPSKKVATALENKYGIPLEWTLYEKGPDPWENFVKKHVIKGESDFAGLKLLEDIIQALKEPEFRRYIYKVLQYILEGGTVNIFQELQQAREKAEGKKEYKRDKFKPKRLRMVAGKDLNFEPTGIVLEFPRKPGDLSEEESERWDQNELALHRWEKTEHAFSAPAWALEKFCRQIVGLYEGGKPKDIGDLLKDFMEEGKNG